MVNRVVTHNDVTGECGLAELTPYPDVVAPAGSGVEISASVAADGKTTYSIDISDALNGATDGITCSQIADFNIVANIGG